MSRAPRFVLVGVMGFAVQIAVLHGLVTAGIDAGVAVLLAVEAAIVHNFVWHERWTWNDRPAARPVVSAIRLARFNTASGLVSLAGNGALTMVLTHATGLPVIAANACATLALAAINLRLADRWVFAGVLAAVVTTAAPRVALAASPAPPLEAQTAAAWHAYVAQVEARRQGEAFGAPGLSPAERARLLGGEVVVHNVAGRTVGIPDGAISHWRGAVFVPGASLEELLDGARLLGQRVRHPDDVIAARVVDGDEKRFRLFLKLRRQAIVTVAYNTEHDVTVERLGADRARSRSVSTRIAELAGLGTPGEREKAAGEDRGFMRRLHSYWRYQVVRGGIIVELESLTLSRDVPWALRPVAGPIIERIARDSVTRTLGVLR